MNAATIPIQRPTQAKLLVIESKGGIRHALRKDFIDFLRPGDLVVANDAATLPASLMGRHQKSGADVEVRLAGRASLSPKDINRFTAIVFGKGDYHTRTEDRPLPPVLTDGDILELGPLCVTAEQHLFNHPRLVSLRFHDEPDMVWSVIARHGKPVQYAHIQTPLALWDVWTKLAGVPVAFEPPSAGFALDWRTLTAMRERGIEFATITHAAGISSTGDAELDKLLPFDEPYHIPQATSLVINRTLARGGRIIAIGTTVVRALEDNATKNSHVLSGDFMATNRIGAKTQLQVVSAILSGTHASYTSHYELLRAFAQDKTLERADKELESHGYLTHEFGDSVFIEREGEIQKTLKLF